MIKRFSLDKLHIFLVLVVVISLVFNIGFYKSYKNIESDLAVLSQSQEGPEAEITEPAETIPQIFTTTEESLVMMTVQSGDTLSKIFSDAGVSPTDVHLISQAIGKIVSTSKIKIGNQVEIRFQPAPPNQQEQDDYYSPIEYAKITTDDKIIEVTYEQEKKSFMAKVLEIPLFKKEVVYEGVINNSLYLSATKAGVSPTMIMEFIKLMSYDVDFQRDIKQNDKFAIYYDYMVNETGDKVRDGTIHYLALTTAKNQHELFRFENNTIKDYFTRKGENSKKALLRTPINGAKITSNFGLRKHPILGFSRMHQGLDYGAPKGTPIFAAGDGVVEFVKVVKGGYGKHIKLKHSANYATLYAHLDRFAVGMKNGTRVSQGQTIGYVGTTGLSSGPHLHYEVHDRGKPVNPAKISFPKVPPLTGTDLTAFKNQLKILEQKIIELKNANNTKHE